VNNACSAISISYEIFMGAADIWEEISSSIKNIPATKVVTAYHDD